jgi:hypothetical protein
MGVSAATFRCPSRTAGPSLAAGRWPSRGAKTASATRPCAPGRGTSTWISGRRSVLSVPARSGTHQDQAAPLHIEAQLAQPRPRRGGMAPMRSARGTGGRHAVPHRPGPPVQRSPLRIIAGTPSPVPGARVGGTAGVAGRPSYTGVGRCASLATGPRRVRRESAPSRCQGKPYCCCADQHPGPSGLGASRCRRRARWGTGRPGQRARRGRQRDQGRPVCAGCRGGCPPWCCNTGCGCVEPDQDSRHHWR